MNALLTAPPLAPPLLRRCAGIALLFSLLALSACNSLLPVRESVPPAPPAWALAPPADSAEWLWGVGEGPDADSARRAALKDVAARLRTRVSASLDSQTRVDNGRVSQQIQSRVTEDVARTEFSQYTVDKTARAGNTAHALVRVDRAAFLRDARTRLEPLDRQAREARDTLDKATPLERLLSLQRLQPALTQATSLAYLLQGADPAGKAPPALALYLELQQRAARAPDDVSFHIVTNAADQDIARALTAYINEQGARVGAQAADRAATLQITCEQTRETVYGNHMARLGVTLAVRDERGRAVASRQYTVSGASRLDYHRARQAAVQNLDKALRASGLAAALGLQTTL